MEPTRRELLERGAGAALAASLAGPALAGPGLADALGAGADAAEAGAAAARPNFLVIIVDSLRADYVGAYGGRARTPNIDALARQGLRFTHFYPEAMATVPARRSIMTGRRIWPFRNWHAWPGFSDTPGWAPIRDPSDTFTSALRRKGYWTGYVTDNPHLAYTDLYRPFRASFNRFVSVPGQLGRIPEARRVSRAELNRWLVPELRIPDIQRRTRSFLASGGAYWEDESRSWAARVFGAGAVALQRAAAGRRPFALVVDTYEPHEPWTPPDSYIDLYGDPRYKGPEPSMGRYKRVDDWLSRRRAGPVLARMRDLYAAEVTMTDRWLGFLTGALAALDAHRNTVIVLVADHGYLLGEHGWTGKIASMLHPELIHVPFVIVDPRPGRRHGARSGYLAQTHDIGPTLLSLAGVRRPEHMDGHDLSPLLRGKPGPGRKFAYGGYANWHYARTQEWAFVSENRGRGRRLYDLDADPGERRNIARRRPRRIDELYGAVARRAGGRAPIYR